MQSINTFRSNGLGKTIGCAAAKVAIQNCPLLNRRREIESEGSYRNNVASAVRPGPKARQTHGRGAWDCRSRSMMNRTVGDDILPHSANTCRDTAKAPVGSP